MLFKVVALFLTVAIEIHANNIWSTLNFKSPRANFDLLSRTKRQSEDACVESCDAAFERHLEINLPEALKLMEDVSNNPVVSFILTQDEFAKFCNYVYKPYDLCINKCPNTESRELAEKLSRSFAYACKEHYNEFYNSIPCVYGLQKEITSECVNKTCNTLRNATQKLADALVVLEESQDFLGFKSLMAENCKFIKCAGQCQFGIISQRCGVEVSKLHKTFDNLAISGGKALYDALGVTELVWPNECNIIF